MSVVLPVKNSGPDYSMKSLMKDSLAFIATFPEPSRDCMWGIPMCVNATKIKLRHLVARHINSCGRNFNKRVKVGGSTQRKYNHIIMILYRTSVSAWPVVHVSSRNYSVISLLTFFRTLAIFEQSWTTPSNVVFLTSWSVFRDILKILIL